MNEDTQVYNKVLLTAAAILANRLIGTTVGNGVSDESIDGLPFDKFTTSEPGMTILTRELKTVNGGPSDV